MGLSLPILLKVTTKRVHLGRGQRCSDSRIVDSPQRDYACLDSPGLIFGSETAKWCYRNRDLSSTYRFLRSTLARTVVANSRTTSLHAFQH